MGTILPDDACQIVELLSSPDNLSQPVGSALTGEPSIGTTFGHSLSSIGGSGRHFPSSMPDPSGPFRQLLPIQEASPLEVAAAAPGDAGAMIEALVGNGADITGQCGVRALMVSLVGGKRTRARTLLHHGVRSHALLCSIHLILYFLLRVRDRTGGIPSLHAHPLGAPEKAADCSSGAYVKSLLCVSLIVACYACY